MKRFKDVVSAAKVLLKWSDWIDIVNRLIDLFDKIWRHFTSLWDYIPF